MLFYIVNLCWLVVCYFAVSYSRTSTKTRVRLIIDRRIANIEARAVLTDKDRAVLDTLATLDERVKHI